MLVRARRGLNPWFRLTRVEKRRQAGPPRNLFLGVARNLSTAVEARGRSRSCCLTPNLVKCWVLVS